MASNSVLPCVPAAPYRPVMPHLPAPLSRHEAVSSVTCDGEVVELSTSNIVMEVQDTTKISIGSKCTVNVILDSSNTIEYSFWEVDRSPNYVCASMYSNYGTWCSREYNRIQLDVIIEKPRHLPKHGWWRWCQNHSRVLWARRIVFNIETVWENLSPIAIKWNLFINI